MFIWRMCTNILPTKENIFSRKIFSNPLCLICGLSTETISHILWSCPRQKMFELIAI
jgi:hypothetical protein